MSATVVQHSTCQDSTVTSGVLYMGIHGEPKCTRCGSQDVPTLAEMVDALDAGDTIGTDYSGALVILTA